MTLHRKGDRKKQTRQPQRQRKRRSTSTSDENSSDGGSITRCICGETHNLGLMVQCDKCEVWQHCRCMGLEQPDIPDQYYCEQCKPENHKTTKLANGRIKRYYNAYGRSVTTTSVVAPKKRMTLNSREACMSLEDVLAARTALEMYDATSPHSSPPTPVTNKRKRELPIKLPDSIDEKSGPPSSTVSSVGHDELPIEQVESPEPIPVQPPKSKLPKRGTERKRVIANGRGGKRGTNKPRSRTCTPQPMEQQQQLVESDQEAAEEEEEQGDTPYSLSTMLFGYFSSQARASSPPAKCRQPNMKMSISEMNKRANHILEYISTIQVEMASTVPSTTSHARPITPQKQQQHYDDEYEDDNDSLSSASTIPLDTKQTSMEIMDMLTRKLIKFQSKFGSEEASLYQKMEGGAEGRITRSNRDVVNNGRNMMAH